MKVMPRVALNEKDAVDLCIGAGILGTGGGGLPDFGIFALQETLKSGRRVEMIGVEDVPDDALILCPAGVGSIAPSPRIEERKRLRAEKVSTESNPFYIALRTLESYLNQKAYATVAVEIGGSNTAYAAVTAALAGIPFVDADPVGRSIPEIDMSTFTIHGVPIAPMAISDVYDYEIIVRKVTSDKQAEDLARAIATSHGGGCSVVCRPIDGRRFRETVISKTVSKALEIGRTLREALEWGRDPVQAVTDAANGFPLFAGSVSGFEWEDRAGHMWGSTTITGDGVYSGKSMRIWFKNENLVSWINGDPFVTCPDLICVLDPATGRAITNGEMKVGAKVDVIGIAAAPVWRSERGLEILSPKRFGFEIEYLPIEERVVRR